MPHQGYHGTTVFVTIIKAVIYANCERRPELEPFAIHAFQHSRWTQVNPQVILSSDNLTIKQAQVLLKCKFFYI